MDYNNYKKIYKKRIDDVNIPSIDTFLNAKQFYINAHGAAPTIREEDGHYPLGIKEQKKSEYSKSGSRSGSLKIKNFTGKIPPNTILVTVTPPGNSLLLDNNELIALELMNFVNKYKLPHMLLDKDSLKELLITSKKKVDVQLSDETIKDNFKAIEKEEGSEVKDEDWIPTFLDNIQVYLPNNRYFNLEQVFENSSISDVFDLNLGWSLNNVKPSHELDAKGDHTFIDSGKLVKFDTIVEDIPVVTRLEAIKTLTLPPKLFPKELIGIGITDRQTESFGTRASKGDSKSYYKEESEVHNKTNSTQGNIFGWEYYPWSLKGIIEDIRSKVDPREWIVIYNFVCNPVFDVDDTDTYGERLTSKIIDLRESLFSEGKKNAKQIGKKYYKTLDSTADIFNEMPKSAVAHFKTFEED